MNTITEREYAELKKMMVETDSIIARMRKMNDEREKLRAETTKIEAEIKWYPAVVGAAILGAGVALAKLFL